jgi:hypothetical protein
MTLPQNMHFGRKPSMTLSANTAFAIKSTFSYLQLERAVLQPTTSY